MNTNYLTDFDRGKSVLVISGCLAEKSKSTLSWTVDNLHWATQVYCEDCKILGQPPRRPFPARETLPYKDKDVEVLLESKPDAKGKTRVINIAVYYQNKEKFLEILRSQ